MPTVRHMNGLAVICVLACKPTEAPSAPAPEPATPTSASQPADDPPASDSARPPGVPPAAPATLGVNDMVGHPARWNDEPIILIARLRYQEVGCTKSVPPSCTAQWMLIDADSDKSMSVPLAEVGVPVPVVCRPAASSLIAASPCAPDELDPTQRYRLEGRLHVERGSSSFVPRRIEIFTETSEQ